MLRGQARAAQRALRQQTKEAAAAAYTDAAARQQARLLKSAQEQMMKIAKLQEELAIVQASAPRSDFTMKEHQAWVLKNSNEQTRLTQEINNAEVRAAELNAQAVAVPV